MFGNTKNLVKLNVWKHYKLCNVDLIPITSA